MMDATQCRDTITGPASLLSKHEISIEGGSLTVGSTHILISKLSSISFVAKRLPLWPGIALGIWAAGVFVNDMMPAARGVEQNSPLFKFAILLAAVAWFVVRLRRPPTYAVMISVEGKAIEVAQCQEEAEASEIVSRIREAATSPQGAPA